MPAAEAEYNSIMDIADQIKQLSEQENPYTTLSSEVRNYFATNKASCCDVFTVNVRIDIVISCVWY